MCVRVSRSVVSDSLDPVDCSPTGSSVHGILQARILEWVAMPFSRDLQPSDPTQVSCTAGRRRLQLHQYACGPSKIVFFPFFFVFRFYVAHLKSLYWMCYNIVSTLCFGVSAPRYVGSQLLDWGSSPHSLIGRRSLNHWTAREVPHCFFKYIPCLILTISIASIATH